MKKYYFLIIVALILGLVLTGCTLLSNIGQVPTSEQSGVTYLTKNGLLSDDLVGLWHFSGNALDSSGNNNLGAVYGEAFYVDHPTMGQALSFDGDGDYVEVADSAILDITSDLTIEAWVKFDSFTSPHSFVVGKDTIGQRSYGLFVDGGYYSKTGKVGFIVFSASSYTIHWGDTALNIGQWYHIAGTYDYVANGTSVMEVYVNGNSDSTATTNAVGPYPPDYWRCFVDGLIDEVRIWKVALPQEQLGKVYDWTGFFRPVDNPGDFNDVVNVAKAGRAIPVKFSLNGDQGLDIFEEGYPKSIPIMCNETPAVGEIEDTVTAGMNILSYDADADQYIYVWKTNNDWASACRQLVVRLNDGTSHEANFKFK
jgi:hypothetical protein